jgi:WD40 repeat protein
MPEEEEISSIPLSTLSWTPWTPLALSPDGHIAVVANQEVLGWVDLWDLSKQQLARQYRGGAQVMALGFNSTGSLLAAGRSDGSVTVWDVATGRLLHELSRGTGCCMGMAFHPVRDEIAVNGPRNTVRIWNARSGQLLDELTCPNPPGCWGLLRLAYRPDGETLAASTDFLGKSILLWEGDRFVSTLTLPDGSAMMIESWSPDGRLLASTAIGERIVLWDMQTLTVAATLEGSGGVASFSPDGAILVTEGSEGQNAILRVLSIP